MCLGPGLRRGDVPGNELASTEHYGAIMIKVLEQAIEKVKSLPQEKQEYAAFLLETLAGELDDVYQLSDEEERLVREGVADLDSARVVSDTDMAEFWNRHRA